MISASISTGTKVAIADFTQNGEPSLRREMETVNDPVMGGTSYSSQEQEHDFLLWSGKVNIVSFLHAPGFCILMTAGEQNFPQNLAEFSGMSYVVSRSSNMLMPMSAEIHNGYVSSSGIPVVYVGVLEERPLDDDKVELYASWSSFKGMFRGQHVSSAPPLNEEGLNQINRVGLSTFSSHEAGEFR
eukprot:CAMPEP_0197835580 /NCGR_PEP_ID=MMETSP1437-20131217/26281_1 /TAXON_ID=49252 ORGANISM="Eucampia antarctica, Strain CCMP1452" /NCGR_SAMPLE_ID=MMETSP1437 /ASSEMBLY_ACC=CAM_ASM_001096 /LENGTH=185 /DNA_ID=CAMNT_0043441137 /DNA_START=131 /DNA_END=685 /DNA_ORIENTATION=+